VIESSAFRKLRKAPLIVRRFGLIQTCQLLLPELVRGTRVSRLFGRPLSRHIARFRMRNSTVLLFRPFSMDLGIFHEIWDNQRYTGGTIGALARRGTVVDIGAHIGLFSLFALRVLQANRIISVEPDPANFELLAKNISANHLEDATLINVAIAGESGDRRIYVNQSNNGGHSFYRRGGSSRPVRAVSLAELFKSSGISECSLLKVDCEGAEMEIFEGGSDELLRNVSAISLEYHLDAYAPERLEKFRMRMERLGFNLESRPTSKTLGVLRGIRRS
jgi:FkbM family methyltransferase